MNILKLVVRLYEDLTWIFVASAADIWSGSWTPIIRRILPSVRPFPSPPSIHGWIFLFYYCQYIVKFFSSVVSRRFSRNMFWINLVFVPPHKGVVEFNIDDIDGFLNWVIIFMLFSASGKCKCTNTKRYLNILISLKNNVVPTPKLIKII